MNNLLGDNPETDTDPVLKELIEQAKTNPELLAKRKHDSDLYIKTLEKRIDALGEEFLKEREENTTKAKLEQLIDKLSERPPQTSVPPSADSGVNKPTLDEARIKSLFESEFSQREQRRREDANLASVRSKIKDDYGEKASEVLNSKLQELSISEDEFLRMAKQSPAVLLRLMEPPRLQETFQAPPRSVTTSGFKPTGPQKRTWSYYQDLKKNDPRVWLDPKTAIQMHNDAIALGDAFQDGDYHRFN